MFYIPFIDSRFINLWHHLFSLLNLKIEKSWGGGANNAPRPTLDCSWPTISDWSAKIKCLKLSQQIESIQVMSWCLTTLSSTIFGGKRQQQIKKSSMQNSQNSKIVDVIHWNLLHCFRSDSLAECSPHTQFAFNFASKDGGYQCQLLWCKWHNRTPSIDSWLKRIKWKERHLVDNSLLNPNPTL